MRKQDSSERVIVVTKVGKTELDSQNVQKRFHGNLFGFGSAHEEQKTIRISK